MLGQPVFIRTVTVETRVVVCSKVSRAGSCVRCRCEWRRNNWLIQLPVCTLISCVILGLLFQAAGPRFGWEPSQTVFGTNQINRRWRSLHVCVCVCETGSAIQVAVVFTDAC